MPHQVGQLPVDIQSRILHKLENASKPKHSGATLSVEEVHVAAPPGADRSITVTESLDNKQELLPHLQQHGKHLIEELNFRVRLKDPKHKDSDIGPGKPGVSTAAQEMLSGTQTPNMGKINLEYDFELGAPIGAASEPGVRAFEQPRDEEALLQLEGDQAWRRLLADTWGALAANHTATHLALKSLVPVWSSAFHTAEFRRFLGRLEGLEIHVSGIKDGHRSINTVPAYNDSLQSLLKVYFLHASSLRRLSLHASQQAPLGARGKYHIPLSLKATQLPALEHLSLKNCFAGFELAHFINGHAGSLRSLELHNCYAFRGTHDGPDAGGMQWARFFALINRPGTALRRLLISDAHIPLTIGDPRLQAYDPDTANEPGDVKNVRRAQRRDPARRLFLYAYLRDYSGELWMNKDAIVAAFENGEDQLAYDELMARVEGNAATHAQECLEAEDCRIANGRLPHDQGVRVFELAA
ncbi:hypothetical protein UCDDA912_g04032 [Diaporthe ampelina]|uniref:F-box domain protein n=1 Tax=Diaporthe ampelina TaxID=1214573 RepID=A0A0G2HLW5_9PEZI|nr:hypothetical protein UCDDA912_g04032 [Diaporthe ampelina]